MSFALKHDDQQLTVVLVSTERRWQGGEEQARQLARGLQQRGHRCLVAALGDGALAERMRSDGFEVLPLAGRSAWPHRCWALRRQLRQRRVDVVHFNDSRAISIGGLSAWRIPRLATIAARRASFPIRSATRYRWLCNRVFCVSSHVASLCRQAGIPAASLRIVHDGVDPGRVAGGDRERGRRAIQVEAGQPLLLAVGSLAECKGHRFLLEAMPQVLQRFPEARLLIAGDGDLRDDLQQRIEHLHLGDHVHLLGFRSDVPDLIHACDLFVFPSIEEGLGSTLIDVMLAGRPIVTTTAGGIPDVVGPAAAGDEACAWLTEPGNSAALAAAITSALHANHQLPDLVRRAERRTQERFTVDQMVEETLAGYREALLAVRGS